LDELIKVTDTTHSSLLDDGQSETTHWADHESWRFPDPIQDQVFSFGDLNVISIISQCDVELMSFGFD
jgi:hypothetical protein